jgi:hypothetical protein
MELKYRQEDSINTEQANSSSCQGVNYNTKPWKRRGGTELKLHAFLKLYIVQLIVSVTIRPLTFRERDLDTH